MSDEVEEWRAVPGWEGYEASSFGRIKSPRRIARTSRGCGTKVIPARILSTSGQTGKYFIVVLRCRGKKKTIRVHQVILAAFRDRPSGYSECRHLNGDSHDNRISNLQWGTRKENADDRKIHGTHRFGSSSCRSKLNEFKVRCALALLAQSAPDTIVARVFNVSNGTINQLAWGNTWRHVARPAIIMETRDRRARC